ncbi:hypothetical protein OGM63_27375 [Plectonema radiosum NIES-515]|uniref:Uncharacterized protein n=1 Tax=Plectonema radiosum NIES-515 TaxID=2986073 RepID=A0ABT3B738_9CYAN|nr:hypothetical protein [Plectonema radiosum]MCV3217186.1 hypothetical protein [Plectonema radiosum NIES-515]
MATGIPNINGDKNKKHNSNIFLIIQRLVKVTEPIGDFVNGNGTTKHEQKCLIALDRILRTGLDLYIEETSELELIRDSVIADWDSKLNFQASFL